MSVNPTSKVAPSRRLPRAPRAVRKRENAGGHTGEAVNSQVHAPGRNGPPLDRTRRSSLLHVHLMCTRDSENHHAASGERMERPRSLKERAAALFTSKSLTMNTILLHVAHHVKLRSQHFLTSRPSGKPIVCRRVGWRSLILLRRESAVMLEQRWRARRGTLQT